ncbi:MAG: DNA-processing protein DprA [Desulfobacterota bacterium]|nr:DNA-processing protein DprA [Thermodesulfobacteriota bacterium]
MASSATDYDVFPATFALTFDGGAANNFRSVKKEGGFLVHEHYYWIALRNVCGIGTVLCKNLIERFGSPQQVFEANDEDLLRVPGVNQRTITALRRGLPSSDAEHELALLCQRSISLVTYTDSAYPRLLRHIYDPPPFLYVRGTLPDGDAGMLAVVGSRSASTYGRRITDQLCRDLAANGITVVSGMARGIDACAHQAAVSAGGKTVAVLGCGVDVIYPPEHKKLYDTIVANGAAVSEYPPGTEPNSYHFPARNRIISGMARGVLVVEAGPNSGSLITARCALDQGRDVFAVPGSVYAYTSKGTNNLLRSGAKVVETAQDILEEFGPCTGSTESTLVNMRQPEDLTAEQERVFGLFGNEPVHIDTLSNAGRFPPGRLAAVLLELELKGLVVELPGKYFARASAPS